MGRKSFTYGQRGKKSTRLNAPFEPQSSAREIIVSWCINMALCGILKLAEVKPRVREFHEWREPFQKVHSKLVKRGWALVSDSGEVGHVAH